MKIDSISVSGFRRFSDSTIDLTQGNFAVLAGANNSGKTSLIQLLNVVFNDEKKRLKFEDFSIKLKERLDTKLGPINDFAEDDSIFGDLLIFLKNEFKIQLKFTVSYEENESIGLFSNYLMDLDDESKKFFFEFQFRVNTDKMIRQLSECEVKSEEAVLDIIRESLETVYFYSDEDFTILNSMDYKEFKKLFHFEYISADRELDDENLKNRRITTAVISSTDPQKVSLNWEEELRNLENNISGVLENSNVKEKFQTATEDALQELKENLDNVTKNEIDSLVADFNITSSSLLKFLRDNLIVNYSHKHGDFPFNLSEESQGLGVSNLIYISLQLNKFILEQKNRPNAVHFFVIEEPESHMHIQMQKVLVSYVETIFHTSKNIQGVITTHSTEIIKNVDVNKLKVIRPQMDFINTIIDMSEFISEQEDKDKPFFETFFNLNFSELIFSDAVIFYEGDAERMYFESLINRKNNLFENLSRQYISYCQCGGAYAHKYFPLIEKLGLVACVFTDIDYSKDRIDLDGLFDDESTNATLKMVSPSAKVGVIYEIQTQPRDSESTVGIFTQTKRDGYARTLEDALLFNLLPEGHSVFSTFSKEEWERFNEHANLTIPKITNQKLLSQKRQEIYNDLGLPSNTVIDVLMQKHPKKYQEYEEFKNSCTPSASIRDLVSSVDKTDFMYSIIMNQKEIDVLPSYIKEGLDWLNQKITTI